MNPSNPPPHAEVSPESAALIDPCPPALKKPPPRRNRPAHIPSDNHPFGERSPLPSHQPKSQKHEIKSKKLLPSSEPSDPSSAPESEKVRTPVRFRRGGRSRRGRNRRIPPPSPSIEKLTPPDESEMTNLEKASNQRPAKKKHVPKLNDENDWRLEPELPDDMRLWRTFSDSLAIFPQHDNKVKGTDTRKDAVFRMLRFLISSTNNIGSPSTPPLLLQLQRSCPRC